MPTKIETAFSKFESTINSLCELLPTWRQFNLRPIQRRALSALQKLNSIIYYPSDKVFGPYVIDQETYIKQMLSEHLLKEENYTRLSPKEANIAMANHKVDFLEPCYKHHQDIDWIHQEKSFERHFKLNPSFTLANYTRPSKSSQT